MTNSLRYFPGSYLEHRRKGNDHAEKVLRLGIDWVLAIKDEEALEILLKLLTGRHYLLNAFLAVLDKFLFSRRHIYLIHGHF